MSSPFHHGSFGEAAAAAAVEEAAAEAATAVAAALEAVAAAEEAVEEEEVEEVAVESVATSPSAASREAEADADAGVALIRFLMSCDPTAPIAASEEMTPALDASRCTPSAAVQGLTLHSPLFSSA